MISKIWAAWVVIWNTYLSELYFEFTLESSGCSNHVKMLKVTYLLEKFNSSGP
jgi:hypothetical protein